MDAQNFKKYTGSACLKWYEFFISLPDKFVELISEEQFLQAVYNIDYSYFSEANLPSDDELIECAISYDNLLPQAIELFQTAFTQFDQAEQGYYEMNSSNLFCWLGVFLDLPFNDLCHDLAIALMKAACLTTNEYLFDAILVVLEKYSKEGLFLVCNAVLEDCTDDIKQSCIKKLLPFCVAGDLISQKIIELFFCEDQTLLPFAVDCLRKRPYIYNVHERGIERVIEFMRKVNSDNKGHVK